MRHLLSYIFHLTRFYCVALCSQALTTSEESAHLCILHTCTKPPGRHSILTQSIDRSPKHTCWPSLHPHTIHQSISQTHLLAVTPSSHNPSINIIHTSQPLHPHTIHPSISQSHLLAVTLSSHNPSIDLPKKHLLPSLCPLMHRHPCCC